MKIYLLTLLDKLEQARNKMIMTDKSPVYYYHYKTEYEILLDEFHSQRRQL